MIARRTYGLIAAGLAAVEAGFELVRLIAAGALRGWTAEGTDIAGITFVAVLALAAVGLALRRSFGYVAAVFGFLASLGYGVMVTAGGSLWGVAYLLVGLGMFACLVKGLPAFRTTLAFA